MSADDAGSLVRRAKEARQRRGTAHLLQVAWAHAWMQLSRWRYTRLLGTTIAGLTLPPYYGRQRLASVTRFGYRSPRARIHHHDLSIGPYAYLGDGVTIFGDRGGGHVSIGERVHLHDGVFVQTGEGGSIRIGDRTHIQAHCHLSAYASRIDIGASVQIAPRCGFYPYDHGLEADRPIVEQSFTTRGPIVVGDGAWLGFGAVVLSGVTIGSGAVVGAGSVVTRDVPAMTIVAGNPARIVSQRLGSANPATDSEMTAEPRA
jgi:acetyltransferase-like isoleucine patch superfamily enzyme